MDWEEFLFKNLGMLNPRVVKWVEKRVRKLPSLNHKIEKEYDEMMADLEGSVNRITSYNVCYTKLLRKNTH